MFTAAVVSNQLLWSVQRHSQTDITCHVRLNIQRQSLRICSQIETTVASFSHTDFDFVNCICAHGLNMLRQSFASCCCDFDRGTAIFCIKGAQRSSGQQGQTWSTISVTKRCYNTQCCRSFINDTVIPVHCLQLFDSLQFDWLNYLQQVYSVTCSLLTFSVVQLSVSFC